MQKSHGTSGKTHPCGKIREARRTINYIQHRRDKKENSGGQSAKNGAGEGSAYAEPN